MMADFKEDYNAALKTLQRLSDALDQMHGVHHDDSKSAAFMLDKLHTWKEQYDLEELEKHVKAYEEGLRARDE